ncbi:MAG: flagellar hook-associated protein FlgK, partial [Chitinispirillia bacterium]|nr:flagellar hook-associated protein FlgK [Chitinispirillia bacterium]
MSLFSVLNVGARGLHTSQMGMDITGQNITNADVEGYSRKRLNLTTMYARDSGFGQIGLGSAIVNIERMRSTFLDQQIRRQNTEVGYFSEVTATFNRIETILCEPSDLGVMQYIDQFFNSWHNLANNPSDIAARTMVRTEAQTMVEHFNRTAKELTDLRQQKNDEIPMRVNRINQISIQILNLNHEIASVEIGNQNANDSRDKRDLLLNELSKLIDISVTENNLGQITVTTAGNVLVAPHYVQQLEVFTKEKFSTVTMDNGTLRHIEVAKDTAVRFSDSKAEYNPPGGHLRGLIDSRDIYIPEYQKRLDELAIAFVNTINDAHREGYTLDGFNGIDFFA